MSFIINVNPVTVTPCLNTLEQKEAIKTSLAGISVDKVMAVIGRIGMFESADLADPEFGDESSPSRLFNHGRLGAEIGLLGEEFPDNTNAVSEIDSLMERIFVAAIIVESNRENKLIYSLLNIAETEKVKTYFGIN